MSREHQPQARKAGGENTSGSSGNHTESRDKADAVGGTPQQVIVLGMHRSGTSALAGALVAMGLHAGEESEVTTTSWQNPRGFFERRDARRICDALLHRSGADWWKVSSFDPDNANFEAASELRPQIAELVVKLNERGHWVLKEPRLCHLLPIFQSALQNPFAVISVRHPVEIARSLRRRNGFPMRAGLALWEAYAVAMIRHGMKLGHVFVDFDTLIDDPRRALGELAGALEARGVEGLDVESGIASIEPGLRRETFDSDTDRGLMSPAQATLWKAFSDRAFRKTPALSPSALNVLREFETDFERSDTAAKSVKSLKAEVNQFKQLESERAAQVAQLRRDVAAAKQQHAEASALAESMKAKAQILEARVDEDKATHAQYLAALQEQAARERASLDARIDARDNEIEAFAARIEELKASHARDLAALQEQAARERASLDARIDARDNEIEAFAARIEELKASHARDLAALQEQAARERASLDARDNEIEAFAARIEELKASHTRDLAALQEQAARERASLDARIKDLTDGETEAKAEAKSRNAEAHELARQLVLAQARIRTAQSQLEAMQTSLGFRAVRRMTRPLHSAMGMLASLPGTKAYRLSRSPLFESAWYADRYPDVGAKGISPSRHYLRWGAGEGRDPHPLFDTRYYLAQAGEAASGQPLLHYLSSDPQTLASPHPLFDAAGYLANNADVKAKGMNPLVHYLQHGGLEGRRPHPLFDGEWYIRTYPDIAEAKVNPLVHYLNEGAREGRDPSPEFSTSAYLRANPGIVDEGMNPLVHYATSSRERLQPAGANSGRETPGRTRSIEQSVSRGHQVTGSEFHKRVASLELAEGPDGWRAALTRSEASIQTTEAKLAAEGKSPLVSIIMPTFNRAAIINEAIQSIAEQSYANWELWVCDDASEDDTEAVVAAFRDARIHYLNLPKGGAAAARNAGLSRARGEIIAYLDSDNIWHPKYLSCMVLAFAEAPGHSCAYADLIDFEVRPGDVPRIRSIAAPAFDHERLLKKNYIDLNIFIHRRELYDAFGGFDDALTRRQDYALILKYTWLRDPLRVQSILALYRREEALNQITRVNRTDMSCVPLIEGAIDRYLRQGLPRTCDRPMRRVTIISWDLCRNHFSKPFALAEALSRDYSVQLVSFRFFEEPIFPPLNGVDPGFDTAYFDGKDFPDFFSALKAALDIIDGDVIYAVKPRLPSLGLALLANAARGTPVLLEINDLETVVSAPRAEDRHAEAALESADLSDAALLSPHSDLWSQLLDPVAKLLPVSLTHNRNLDQHFGKRSLYMRNLKDEAVYDPENYDRDAIRAELGFGPDDRVILFGGLLRKHKGIYELVELVERLGDPRYKLLFVGSRPTPDQRKLVERYGERVKVMPPQNREAMARINLAADLVILWLDPDVPASRYQMPYKATDAFAMGPTVIANPISDLEPLARQGYLKLVDYGDWEGMSATIRALFDHPEERERIRASARRLYQRQFSYGAARSNFELAARRALNHSGPLPAAMAFAERFNAFFRQLRKSQDDFLPLPEPASASEPEPIRVLDAAALGDYSLSDPDGVAIVMPSIDTAKARATAEILLKRAGMPATVLIAEDTARRGFIATLNAIAARLDVKYVVYLAEDAFPGVDWLKIAHERLEETGKGLLAFNCGKWRGRIAAFGMVRASWVKTLYCGPILYPGYKAHKADNELTVIARLENAFVYAPDATLVEIDASKTGWSGEDVETAGADRALFRRRLHGSFGGRFRWRDVEPFKEEYLNRRRVEQPGHEPEDKAARIRLLDVADLGDFALTDPEGVAIVMPSIDTAKAHATAELLLKRAGMPATVLIAEDTARRGFIATLNAIAARLDVKYVVYLAEDAFPGVDWLKIAHERLEETGKGLLAFNCGKWRGRIAAFGMVRTSWVKTLYGGPILYPGYKAHKADNELTVIARVTDKSVYADDAVLVEVDPGKVFKENVPEDKTLFHERFRQGFDGNADPSRLNPMAEEYFVKIDKGSPIPGKKAAVTTDPPAGAFRYYRIIGNDLYPRHKPGQSLENLEFILRHEPEFDACTKAFVLNRIFDPDIENSIRRLLDRSGHEYIRIPFDPEEYRRIGFDVDVSRNKGFLTTKAFDEFEDVKRARIYAALYRLKNNYVMNNNGARNATLEHGTGRARWLMPFDGNCFLTERAWGAITTDIAAAPEKTYFVVPMARMLSNDALINGGEIPEPVEEPQIIFRHDAPELFNEAFPYGRRPKVEMLWRLGVPGKWDTYRDDAWDPPRARTKVDSSLVGYAGWVARLFSGKEEFEAASDDATLQRGFVRTEAILATLRHLDMTIARAHPERTTSILVPAIERCLGVRGGADARVREQLTGDADAALERGPHSVLDKTTLPPSGDRQDYWHPAPYWWPDPDKPDGLPYMRRDGERVPGTRMYEPDSDKYDRTRLQRVFDDTLVLSLAHRMTGKDDYARHAAAIIKRFFVDPETRMNPHLKYGQVRMGHNRNQGAPTGLIEMKDLYFHLDAARLLHGDGALSKADIDAFKAWLKAYLQWLLTSPQGKAERRAANNHGTCYDLQIGSVAAFLGDSVTLYETLARANSRIAEQFDGHGRQPDELKRTTTAHYCCFNFQSWINLARLAERWGVDLWAYEAPDGAGLKQGARWLLSHMGKPWPYEQIDAFDTDRFLPIWFAADAAGVDGLPALPHGVSGALDVKPVFFPHDGVRPYWNLDTEQK